MSDIQPADVYQEVVAVRREVEGLQAACHNLTLVGVSLAVLVGLQILAKFGIFWRVISLLNECRRLLWMSVQHGRITEGVKDQAVGTLQEVKHAAQVIALRAGDLPLSDPNIPAAPTPGPPP